MSPTPPSGFTIQCMDREGVITLETKGRNLAVAVNNLRVGDLERAEARYMAEWIMEKTAEPPRMTDEEFAEFRVDLESGDEDTIHAAGAGAFRRMFRYIERRLRQMQTASGPPPQA